MRDDFRKMQKPSYAMTGAKLSEEETMPNDGQKADLKVKVDLNLSVFPRACTLGVQH